MVAPASQEPLRNKFGVHPVVEQDPRIPSGMYDDMQGHHPGEILRQRRLEEGYTDPQQYVDAVNKLLRSYQVSFRFSVEELEAYESGTRPISNSRLSFLSEVLNSNPVEILYNRRGDGSPVVAGTEPS
jgi:hypothetical protein